MSMNDLACALVIGAGATAVMDVWSIVRRAVLGIPALDYGLLGRWLGHLLHGRFRHERIAASPPVLGEKALGWIAHYLIGVVFAAGLLAIVGGEWACAPTIAPALVLGIGTVVAPFFILQPAFGAGIAGSRTPRPSVTRLHSLLTHIVFGLGLYASAWLVGSYVCSS